MYSDDLAVKQIRTWAVSQYAGLPWSQAIRLHRLQMDAAERTAATAIAQADQQHARASTAAVAAADAAAAAVAAVLGATRGRRTVEQLAAHFVQQGLLTKVLVATVDGQGPDGPGDKQQVGIYSLARHPPQFSLGPLAEPPTRRELDVYGDGVPRPAVAFFVDGVLAPGECDALAAASEAIGYSRFAPLLRVQPLQTLL